MIRIPDLEPRFYQLPLLKAMDEGCKRAAIVWHRRAGKEIVCFNIMIKKAYASRVGNYVYFFPTSRLGRRILWDGVNKDGKRFINYIPKEIIEGKPNETEMRIRLKNGSTIQIIGTDDIVNVGINPVGCVFSEFSLQDPSAWNLIRPILRENEGWSIFNFTPRGKNHAWELYQMARTNDNWFCQRLSIEDTGVLSTEDMDKERKEGMSEDLIRQEYYCSFEQGIEGAFYAKYLHKAEVDGRVCTVPYDPSAPVHTFWDLGVSDATSIIFVQNIGKEVHLIDYYQNEGEGLNHYARVLQEKSRKDEWSYGKHWAPHDIRVRELGSGAQTRLEIARGLGIDFDIVPNLPVVDGIELSRGLFNRLWIDRDKCNFLLKCFENYHKRYNEKMGTYSEKPVHDWSSHAMDAFRMLAVSQSSEDHSRRMTEREAMDMERLYTKRY